MYVSISVIIVLDLVGIDTWKKLVTAALTLPEYVGFVLWLSNNTKTTRKIYLISQYFTYFSLLLMGVYHMVNMLFNYFLYHDNVSKMEIIVTGSMLLAFGLLGAILLAAFQDYSSMHLVIDALNDDTTVPMVEPVD